MTTENDNFLTNFTFLVNEENLIEIWDNLTYIGLTPDGWIEHVSKYDVLNDLVGEYGGRYMEIYIDKKNNNNYFMLWWHDNLPELEIKDTKEVMEELSLVKKNLYK